MSKAQQNLAIGQRLQRLQANIVRQLSLNKAQSAPNSILLNHTDTIILNGTDVKVSLTCMGAYVVAYDPVHVSTEADSENMMNNCTFARVNISFSVYSREQRRQIACKMQNGSQCLTITTRPAQRKHAYRLIQPLSERSVMRSCTAKIVRLTQILRTDLCRKSPPSQKSARPLCHSPDPLTVLTTMYSLVRIGIDSFSGSPTPCRSSNSRRRCESFHRRAMLLEASTHTRMPHCNHCGIQ